MRIGLLITLALLLPSITSAQALGSLENANPFTVSVTPQYPTPLGQVSLSFISATIDLTNATLKISVNGKQTYQGSVQPIAVTLGKTGGVTTVTATITSAGIPYRQSVVIQPEQVSIIAEPLSSASVLYPGKPFVPNGGNTRVVAVANFKDASGRTLNPSTLSYSWTVDGTQIANSSGIGKEAIIVASPLQYRERPVSVVIQSQEGSLVGGASLTLSPAEPSVRIYANDPLLGILFNRALSGTYTISGAEAGLYAVPFSLPLTGSTPTLQWFLQGALAQSGPTITLRPTGSGEGNATLSFTSSTDASAKATAQLSLLFGATKNTNLFGL